MGLSLRFGFDLSIQTTSVPRWVWEFYTNYEESSDEFQDCVRIVRRYMKDYFGERDCSLLFAKAKKRISGYCYGFATLKRLVGERGFEIIVGLPYNVNERWHWKLFTFDVDFSNFSDSEWKLVYSLAHMEKEIWDEDNFYYLDEMFRRYGQPSREIAFAMGRHVRLGLNGPIRLLPDEILHDISLQSVIPRPFFQ